jgi:NAD-dependent deacetylase
VAEPTEREIAAAARHLARSGRLLVLTGAGLSADAGIPTFRGTGGLWNEHRAEDLATLDGFRRDPALVWDWYRERRDHAARCQPHTGQRSLALLPKSAAWRERVLVATTNEDDLLDRAGLPEAVHLHGSLFETACAGRDGTAPCGWRARDDARHRLSHAPCPRCGAPVRPGSVWFGEPLPATALDAIRTFAADGCLVVGSSCLVQPVASIPADLAAAGAPVVEVNPEDTPLTPKAAAALRGTAKDMLPPLIDQLTSPTMRDQRRRMT